MAGESDQAWQQLGDVLQRRRVELSPRFKNMALFARESGLNERLVFDIEHGRRTGYRPMTRRALEIAYQLDSGWIDRFIAGQQGPVADGDRPRVPDSTDGQGAGTWASLDGDEKPASFSDEEWRIARAFVETLRRSKAERDRAPNGGRASA